MKFVWNVFWHINTNIILAVKPSFSVIRTLFKAVQTSHVFGCWGIVLDCCNCIVLGCCNIVLNFYTVVAFLICFTLLWHIFTFYAVVASFLGDVALFSLSAVLTLFLCSWMQLFLCSLAVLSVQFRWYPFCAV